MTMVRGPWFFRSFGGGWRFTPDGAGTQAVWKYTYAIRPSWLAPIAEPIGQRLGPGGRVRERRRILEVEAAHATLERSSRSTTRTRASPRRS